MEILVKKMMESRGLSIRSAAKQCGLTYSTLTGWVTEYKICMIAL